MNMNFFFFFTRHTCTDTFFTDSECVAESMEGLMVALHLFPVQLPAGCWSDD